MDATPTLTPELLTRYDRPGPRYTSYPTAPLFSEEFGADEYVERLERARASGTSEPLSIYAHLPFCEKRCLFCACNVIISPRYRVVDPYLERFEREVELVAGALGDDRRAVAQLHWGGGTPTYLTPADLRRVWQMFLDRFTLTDDAEIAVEVDPRVTTEEHLDVLLELGFNRLSMGVQDCDPTVQKAIRRVQPIEQTEALIQRARAAGVDSINIDLIYGLPHQTTASFEQTLELVAALRPERLAVYSFAYVPWLKGHQKKLDPSTLPDGETKLELLCLARDVLMGEGYQDIGMDHFALPEDELAVAQREGRLHRNFMGYTTVPSRDMLGFGVSSIGYVGDAYVQNTKKLSRYYAALDAGELPVERGLSLGADDLLRAHVIRELMCNFTVRWDDVADRFGVAPTDALADALERLRPYEADGMVRLHDEGIDAVGAGKLFVRNLAMAFDAYLEQPDEQKPRFSQTV